MIALTKELQQAVQDANEQPIRLVDPETSLEYVVLPARIGSKSIRHHFAKVGPDAPR